MQLHSCGQREKAYLGDEGIVQLAHKVPALAGIRHEDLCQGVSSSEFGAWASTSASPKRLATADMCRILLWSSISNRAGRSSQGRELLCLALQSL